MSCWRGTKMTITAVPQERSPYGYVRDDATQAAFENAAKTLLQSDGWPNPLNGGKKELRADLALEGGGVKGIGLIGAVLALSEAGYTFRGVAGTSAGAIAASLVAGLSRQTRLPMTTALSYMNELDFSKFMPEGKIHHFLDHEGGRAGKLLASAEILAHNTGIYNGDYLKEWLAPKLHGELEVNTFGDLKLKTEDDPEISAEEPGMSLSDGRDYRLVVHVSDITRRVLVRLPWDYPLYNGEETGDSEDPVDAVRASMSIPFFFHPVTFDAKQTKKTIPDPSGGSTTLTYGGGTVTWVDGGMLQNFPIHAFDRVDGRAPRWPTIGIKLSKLQTEYPATEACESALAVGIRCVRTMMNEWDSYAVDEQTAARTIFVDNAGLHATDFDLDENQQETLFINGVRAATAFVIEMADAGGVPRTSDQAKALADERRRQLSSSATP
jgi:NTE family protein